MIPLLPQALALLLSATTADGYDTAMAELERGRFRAAELALASEADPLRAAHGRIELAYRGRDFARALEAAEDALELAPGDVRFLQRAAAAAVWLRQEAPAETYVTRLDAAVQALPEAEVAAWEEVVADLRARTGVLQVEQASLERCIARARGVSLAGITLALAAMAFCLRRR